MLFVAQYSCKFFGMIKNAGRVPFIENRSDQNNTTEQKIGIGADMQMRSIAIVFRHLHNRNTDRTELKLNYEDQTFIHKFIL